MTNNSPKDDKTYLHKPIKGRPDVALRKVLTKEEIKKASKDPMKVHALYRDLPEFERYCLLAVINDNVDVIKGINHYWNVKIDDTPIQAYIVGCNAINLYKFFQSQNYINLKTTQIPMWLPTERHTIFIPLALFVAHQDFVRECAVLKVPLSDTIHIYHRDIFHKKRTLYDNDVYCKWQIPEKRNVKFDQFVTPAINRMPVVKKVKECIRLAYTNRKVVSKYSR